MGLPLFKDTRSQPSALLATVDFHINDGTRPVREHKQSITESNRKTYHYAQGAVIDTQPTSGLWQRKCDRTVYRKPSQSHCQGVSRPEASTKHSHTAALQVHGDTAHPSLQHSNYNQVKSVAP